MYVIISFRYFVGKLRNMSHVVKKVQCVQHVHRKFALRIQYVRTILQSSTPDATQQLGSDMSPCCRYWYCRGRGGVLQTVLQGEGGGIVEIRERGVGDFIFGKLTVILKNLSKILSI